MQCLSTEETMNQRATHSPSWCLHHLGFLSYLKSCFYCTAISIHFRSFFFSWQCLGSIAAMFVAAWEWPGSLPSSSSISWCLCGLSFYYLGSRRKKSVSLSGYNENNMDSYISNTRQSWRRGNSHTVALFPPWFPTYSLLEDSFCFLKINYLFMSWNFGKI